MRLSEAIRLGLSRYKLDNNWTCKDGGCLLHIAGLSVGSEITSNMDAATVWPWLLNPVPYPSFMATLPKKEGYFSHLLGIDFNYAMEPLYLVQALAVSVRHGDISIDKVCDWIASVEPTETHTGTTIDELTEMADEVLAPYLPPDWTKERWIRAMAEHRGEGE